MIATLSAAKHSSSPSQLRSSLRKPGSRVRQSQQELATLLRWHWILHVEHAEGSSSHHTNERTGVKSDRRSGRYCAHSLVGAKSALFLHLASSTSTEKKQWRACVAAVYVGSHRCGVRDARSGRRLCAGKVVEVSRWEARRGHWAAFSLFQGWERVADEVLLLLLMLLLLVQEACLCYRR